MNRPPLQLCPHCGSTSRRTQTVRPLGDGLRPGDTVCWFSSEPHRGIHQGVYQGVSERFPWLVVVTVEPRRPEDAARQLLDPRNLFRLGVAQGRLEL